MPNFCSNDAFFIPFVLFIACFLVFARIRLTHPSTLLCPFVRIFIYFFHDIDFSSVSHYSVGLSLVLTRTVIFRADVKFIVASS